MRPLIIVCALLALPAAQAADSGFIKVCVSGETAGQGSCPATPGPGAKPNDWGCSKDQHTGLIWSLANQHGTWLEATRDFPQAMNDGNRCGLSQGWRAPTRAELLTLQPRSQSGWLSVIRHGKQAGPAIYADYFPDTRSDWYWSADTLDADPAYAWFVFFARGYSNSGNAYSGFKTAPHYIRLVNGG